MEDENKLIEERREKLKALRARGIAFPNDFRRRNFASELHEKYAAKTKEELEPLKIQATVAGRMVLKRVMGKASFATLQDGSGRIQIYVANDVAGKLRLAGMYGSIHKGYDGKPKPEPEWNVRANPAAARALLERPVRALVPLERPLGRDDLGQVHAL